MKAALAEANGFSLFAKFISSLSAQSVSFRSSLVLEGMIFLLLLPCLVLPSTQHAQFNPRETKHEYI